VHTITEHILTSDRSASKLYSKYVELSEDAISNDHFYPSAITEYTVANNVWENET